MKTFVLASLSVIGMILPVAQADTHLGQPSAASHVTLVSKTIPNAGQANKCQLASFTNKNLYRVKPDGTTESTPFVVPAGQFLVVTDIEWTAQPLNSGGTFAAEWSLRLDIGILKPGVSGSGNLVYTSPGISVNALNVSDILGGSDNLTSGFVVGPGASLCPGAYQSRPSSWIARSLASFVAHGYLSP